MSKIVAILFVIVGLINFLPVMGLVSEARLAMLYSINLEDQNLVILMRHRALLFGIIGALTIYAAFAPRIRLVAGAAAFVSMAGFLAIAWSEQGYNAALQKVVMVDLVGIAVLVLAIILQLTSKKL